MKNLGNLLRETFQDWLDDEAPMLAASLSYYTIFSLAPLTLIMIGAVSVAFGESGARESIMRQLESLMGPEGARAIGQMLQSSSEGGHGAAATVLGLLLLLVGASGVFGQLQTALNKIWAVAPAPDRGILGTLQARFLSMSMVLGIGFLLIVSLATSAAVASMGHWLTGVAPWTQAGAQFLEGAVNIVVFTGLFAMIFKILPDVDVEWGDVWVGSLATAVLFSLGKVAIGMYLAKSGTASTFGAAGSLVVLLLWIDYSSMLLFLGAEFTQVWARRHGSAPAPSRGAVRVLRKWRIPSPDAPGQGS